MESRVKMNIPVPQNIIAIKNIFVANGHKLFVVGGAVRDALLGKIPKDWDLATDAVPDKVESMMKEAGLKTLPTGKQFGVINVFSDSGEYEIATFRRDVSYGEKDLETFLKYLKNKDIDKYNLFKEKLMK